MRRKCYLFFFVGALFFFMGISQADAATMSINGYVVESPAYVIENDTTMVSEDFLKNVLHLSVVRSQDDMIISNKKNELFIRGKVGETAYILNGTKKNFSQKVAEKDGHIYIPLRSLIENFGGIGWDGIRQVINIQYDYNRMINIPKAKLTEESVKYESILNGGMQATQERTPVTELNGHAVFEERDKEGALQKIYSGQEALIAPLHKNYVLGNVYGIDENYIYWIEYPKNENDLWYMYIKDRTVHTDPTCVTKGSFNALREMPYGIEILNNIYFSNGKIAYLYYDGINHLEVHIYKDSNKENKILDRISLKEYPNATMQIALNDNEVIWNKLLCLADSSQYGTMYRYNIDKQEIKPFYEGCNLLAPILLGEYLIVRNKPMGQNFIYDNKKIISGEIWVYSLREEQWIYKIDNTIPIVNGKYVVTTPIVLDENHITFHIEGVNAYGMPIVNLKTGKIYIAKNQEGKPLIYSPVERAEKSVVDIYHVEKDMYYATILENNQIVVAPIKLYLK